MEVNILMSKVGDHQQVEGTMMYDTLRDDECRPVVRMLGFQPDEDMLVEMQSFSGTGSVKVRSDGSVDVVMKKRVRSQAELIRKTNHGRASYTADGAIQLTLKFFVDSESDIYDGMRRESAVLLRAIRDYEIQMNG